MIPASSYGHFVGLLAIVEFALSLLENPLVNICTHVSRSVKLQVDGTEVSKNINNVVVSNNIIKVI